MKKILYLGFYDTPENTAEKRNAPPAGQSKMDYICSAINRAGWDVEIVSACRTSGTDSVPGHHCNISKQTTLTLFPSSGRKGTFSRIVRTIETNWFLFWHLMKSIKKGAPLLAYHSLGYTRLLLFLKRITKFRLILEVEEIYSDVTNSKKNRDLEQRLFRAADAYLFPTELLNENLNKEGKPFSIAYGNYSVASRAESSVFSQDEQSTIHLLYAGTLDPRKGGAQAVVQAVTCLPENYHVHILGFGTPQDVADLQTQIANVSQAAAAKLTYDGLLHGEDYVRFVQSCHVGFSTQSPDGNFNDTSFPSKVLSYLANGLRVVSVRIPVLERSAVNDLLYYFDENTPEAIAKVVQNIDFSQPYNPEQILHHLDTSFVQKIGAFLND